MASTDGPQERATPPAPHGTSHDAALAIEGPLADLTRWLALVGGGLLLIAVAITLVSVIGRYGFGRPVPGDYELIELICAVGVFLFFPYTHATDGNISAKFFTSGLSQRRQRSLDLANDVVFALVAALLTWRLALGLLDKFSAGDATILIRIPIWWAFSFAVASMALLTIVCLFRIAAGVRALRP
jgi:TRAP-type C4-dicarboxylate transport system permease small subunit